MTQEDDNISIAVTAGTLYTGADLNAPDTMGTLTVEVTVEARYKHIKEFMAIDKISLEDWRQFIDKRKRGKK